MSILIKNISINTQDKNRRYVYRGFIVIKKDKIKKIGSGNPGNKDVKEANEIINGEGLIASPGLINAHIHLGESIFINLFKKKFSLENYLKITDKISEKTDIVEKNRKTISDYSLLRLLKSGTTTICGGRTFDMAESWGIRNISGYMIMESNKLKNFGICLDKKFSEEYKKIKLSKISHPAIFIHSINKINLRLLPKIQKLLIKFPDTKLILHLAETKIQEEEVNKKLGMSSVQFLEKNKLLGENTILIHCNWIKDKDFKLIKKRKSSIVQCLSSNINTADRVLDLKKVLKNKIKTCLATDGFPTSKTFDIAEESQKCFFYYQKLIPINKCADLVTIDAAKVIGLEKIIGSIEKGKKADLIFYKKNNGNQVMGRKKIKGVIIDGSIKIWNGRVLITNENSIIKGFNRLSNKIIKYYEYIPNKK